MRSIRLFWLCSVWFVGEDHCLLCTRFIRRICLCFAWFDGFWDYCPLCSRSIRSYFFVFSAWFDGFWDHCPLCTTIHQVLFRFLPGSIASGIVILSAHDSSGLICLYSLPGSVATGIIVLSARDPAGNFLCNYRPVQGGSGCVSPVLLRPIRGIV